MLFVENGSVLGVYILWLLSDLAKAEQTDLIKVAWTVTLRSLRKNQKPNQVVMS